MLQNQELSWHRCCSVSIIRVYFMSTFKNIGVEKLSKGSSDLNGLLKLVFGTFIRSLLCKSLSHVESRNYVVYGHNTNEFCVPACGSGYGCNAYLLYVGIKWLVSLVLHLRLFRFTPSNLCCIIEHRQKPD